MCFQNDSKEDTKLKRKAYNKTPNGYFDENDELLLTLQSSFQCGSAIYCNVFVCSKCLKAYYAPEALKKHSANCAPSFGDIIFRQQDLSIAHVTGKSKDFERAICERLQKLSRDEGDRNLQISLGEGQWKNMHHMFSCFLRSVR